MRCAISVTGATHCRWYQEYHSLKSDQVRRIKGLELESQRLRRAVADLTLDKLLLVEAARENGLKPRVALAPELSI